MKVRIGAGVTFLLLVAVPAFAQSAPGPSHPFSAGALGGFAAGQGDTGAAIRR